MDELELSFIQREVERLVLETPSPGKQAARNALHHIKRAWRIREVDPEMAAFRSITAEEEAARALMHALQRHRYPGADRLNWRKHTHKAAVVPFLLALQHAAAKLAAGEAELGLFDEGGTERLKLRLKLTADDGRVSWLEADPPLDFGLDFDGAPYDFASELTRSSNDLQEASIEEYVAKRANERNRLLYATDTGVPTILGGTEEVLRIRCGHVFRVLIAYLMIDAYRKHQALVVQCLALFLDLVERVEPRRKSRARREAT